MVGDWGWMVIFKVLDILFGINIKKDTSILKFKYIGHNIENFMNIKLKEEKGASAPFLMQILI